MPIYQFREKFDGIWSEWMIVGAPRRSIVTILADFSAGAKVVIKTKSGHQGQWRIKR